MPAPRNVPPHPAYRFFEPIGEFTPVFVSVPHAGLELPEPGASLCIASESTRLSDADMYVDELYAYAPHQGAGLIAANISRYILDLNRSPSQVDTGAVADWHDKEARNPRGLVWHTSTAGEKLLSRPLTFGEYAGRVENIHRPYYDAIQAALDERRKVFGYAILVDAHSMPSVGRKTHGDTGSPRAQVVPGNRDGRSCAPELSRFAGNYFAGLGYQVRFNEPYRGGNITAHFGRPSEGIHAIQIELRRDIYMDEETFARRQGEFERLTEQLTEFIAELCELRLPAASIA